jgi:hypothetical protein
VPGLRGPSAALVGIAALVLLSVAPGPRRITSSSGDGALVLDPTNKFTHVADSASAELRMDAAQQTATINVTYVGFEAFPAAQAAFQHAVDIWSGLIVAPVPITVRAEFSPLDRGVLGSAGAGSLKRNFPKAPAANFWYPIALANQYSGQDLDPAGFDISATFSSSVTDWYFGTDGNTPANAIDFTTTVLHELGHGLGFAGSMQVSSGIGTWGYSGLPTLYDWFAANGSVHYLVDTSFFANPSAALAAQLQSGNVWWYGLQAYGANGAPPKLYAPSVWRQGSSYSHLDESAYPAGSANSLMTYALGYAESIHNPGPIAIGILHDIGWMTACSFSVSETSFSGGPGGGADSVSIVGPAGCSWSAVSNAAFVTLTSEVSGTGPGTVGFSVAPNVLGTPRSATISVAGQTVTITQSGVPGGPIFSLDRPTLNFGAISTGAVFASRTDAQVVRLTQSGAGTANWTATSNAPWLTVSPASGTGPAALKVSVRFVPGLPATSAGAITISLNGGTSTLPPISVRLGVTQNGASAAPFGGFDTPTDGTSGVTGSIGVTGWALDDVQVSRVRIQRDPVPGEPPGVQVYVGDAAFVDGARPDVAGKFTLLPQNTRAGWGYMLLTNFLPALGDGTFKLYAFADDSDGHSTLLGTKTITCTNSAAVNPFGAIDTPAQGATVSGIVDNFGWTLGAGGHGSSPADGGTVNVFIDGTPVGVPGSWTNRPDLSALFPAAQYPGVGTALAVFTFDSRSLANGVHTISWGVTDSAGNTAGVGSRYFNVSNGSHLASAPADTAASAPVTAHDSGALLGRTGFSLEQPYQAYQPSSGVVTIQSEEFNRIELKTHATKAFLRTGLGLAPLPVGARLDADGSFTWQPGVAFVGSYEFVFVSHAGEQRVKVVLNPKRSDRVGPQIAIDSPAVNQNVAPDFIITGWAADLDAEVTGGVDAVHVWAYPTDDGDPIFLGPAVLGETRPDVAAVYGTQFGHTGYHLGIHDLAPGTYDIAVFAWSSVRGAFVPAKTVRVRVR